MIDNDDERQLKNQHNQFMSTTHNYCERERGGTSRRTKEHVSFCIRTSNLLVILIHNYYKRKQKKNMSFFQHRLSSKLFFKGSKIFLFPLSKR